MLKKKLLTNKEHSPLPRTPKIVDRAIVDGEQWYTVTMGRDASIWFRETFAEQEDKLWFDHIDQQMYIHANQKDMHEKLFFELSLRWS